MKNYFYCSEREFQKFEESIKFNTTNFKEILVIPIFKKDEKLEALYGLEVGPRGIEPLSKV